MNNSESKQFIKEASIAAMQSLLQRLEKDDIDNMIHMNNARRRIYIENLISNASASMAWSLLEGVEQLIDDYHMDEQE